MVDAKHSGGTTDELAEFDFVRPTAEQNRHARHWMDAVLSSGKLDLDEEEQGLLTEAYAAGMAAQSKLNRERS